jgi:HK97 family phage major capsid protein
MTRLQQIEQRLAAIEADINTRGEAIPTEELQTLNQEVTDLKAERTQLLANAEQRNGILAGIAEGRTGTPAPAQSAHPTPGQPAAIDQRGAEIEPTNTLEYRRAFMAYVLRGTAIPEEVRADATTYTTDIGAVIPNTVLNQIVEKMESAGRIFNLVTRTAYKGGLEIPTASAKPVASWVNEGAGSDKQKKTTGSVTFAYHKLRCAVAVSLETDTMALSAFEATLVSNITYAMLDAIDAAIINGTGTGQPKGILTETPVTGQAVAVPNTGVTFDTLIQSEAAIPDEYEGSAIWCMNKKRFMSFIGLTDENGQPIARVNYGLNGKPERTLLGRTVEVNKNIADNKAFIFDFTDYVVNTNLTITIKKYEDNDTDDQVTKGIMLVDGKVVDKNSLVIVTIAAS